MLSSVLLPQPLGPIQRHHFAVRDPQIHVGNRREPAARGIGKAHRDVAIFETGRSRHPQSLLRFAASARRVYWPACQCRKLRLAREIER
jgi:hypothetical protein